MVGSPPISPPNSPGPRNEFEQASHQMIQGSTAERRPRSHQRHSKQLRSPSAKRSPSILVTDSRKGQVQAPFAGHRLRMIRQAKETESREKAVRAARPFAFMRGRKATGKYSNISISQLTSNISDIPSSSRREPTFLSRGAIYARGPNGIRPMPQFLRALPKRSTKSLQKLVLIPDRTTLANSQPEFVSNGTRRLSTEHKVEDIFLNGYKRTKAESLTKEQRELEYPRVTAYLIAEGFNLKLTGKFLEKYHHVSTRLYDDMLYASYSLPLLPGDHGYRVKSNDSAKNERGNELMEALIKRSENKEHHYEFYSGEDVENPGTTTTEGFVGQNGTTPEFNPSEPQFFQAVNVSSEEKENGSDNSHSSNSNEKSDTSKNSELPDLTKHADLFVLNYGVVVFWNFSEVHEKNILADLSFAKLGPEEFNDENDEDNDEGEDGFDEEEGEDDDYEEEEEEEDSHRDEEGRNKVPLQMIIKPVPEQDIEMEDFHFEYNNEVPTPRIYNDMITLKSGDHLIKLTISHAIAQSSKMSMFESKMSVILDSISKLPKILALTGRLHHYTSKKLLMKTGGLLQLRSEVNLNSNVVDTPEYFWSIEPGLHPLYMAIREYLEIDQRVEVINDRCKVFLDFFDIVSDSLAENQMFRITKFLIIAIGLNVVVSVLEIIVRYFLIHND